MSNEQFIALIVGVLAAGSGVVIQWILSQIVKWREEDGKPISPKTKRRLALLLCVTVPTALYLLVVWLSVEIEYRIGVHAGYVLGAFTAMQMWHGETKLMSGADIDRQTLEAYAHPVPHHADHPEL